MNKASLKNNEQIQSQCRHSIDGDQNSISFQGTSLCSSGSQRMMCYKPEQCAGLHTKNSPDMPMQKSVSLSHSIDQDNQMLSKAFIEGIALSKMINMAQQSKSDCVPITQQQFLDDTSAGLSFIDQSAHGQARKRFFKWREYCVKVFASLRGLHDIQNDDYFESILGGLVQLKGNRMAVDTLVLTVNTLNLGTRYFVTSNNMFSVQQITPQQERCLLKILKDYYYYVQEQPQTCLTQYYGVYEVQLPLVQCGHTVLAVTNNHGTASQVIKLGGALMSKQKFKIYLDHVSYTQVILQLRNDFQFLSQHGINNYCVQVALYGQESSDVSPSSSSNNTAPSSPKDDFPSKSVANTGIEVYGAIVEEGGGSWCKGMLRFDCVDILQPGSVAQCQHYALQMSNHVMNTLVCTSICPRQTSADLDRQYSSTMSFSNDNTQDIGIQYTDSDAAENITAQYVVS